MESLATQGIALPRLGLGTFRLQGDACRLAVEGALAMGYRHLDTAEMYANEDEVGAAIQHSALMRRELHVTTKVWHEHLAPPSLRRSFEASLQKLRLDYIDLYLIHWPSSQMDLAATFGELRRLQEEKLLRAVGVANFNIALLRTAVEQLGMPVACNQVEYHVFLGQEPLLAYLRAHQIPLVAYCPLAQGRVMQDPTLQAVAHKHHATPAQIALKWLLDQPGVCAIPKASRSESQRANLAALDVRLDEEDRRAIAALPKSQRLVNPAFAPIWD